VAVELRCPECGEPAARAFQTRTGDWIQTVWVHDEEFGTFCSKVVPLREATEA
jgi:hypothetical protein